MCPQLLFNVPQAMEAFGHRLSQQGLWLKLAAGATGLQTEGASSTAYLCQRVFLSAAVLRPVGGALVDSINFK